MTTNDFNQLPSCRIKVINLRSSCKLIEKRKTKFKPKSCDFDHLQEFLIAYNSTRLRISSIKTTFSISDFETYGIQIYVYNNAFLTFALPISISFYLCVYLITWYHFFFYYAGKTRLQKLNAVQPQSRAFDIRVAH